MRKKNVILPGGSRGSGAGLAQKLPLAAGYRQPDPDATRSIDTKDSKIPRLIYRREADCASNTIINYSNRNAATGNVDTHLCVYAVFYGKMYTELLGRSNGTSKCVNRVGRRLSFDGSAASHFDVL